jgi:protein gp37
MADHTGIQWTDATWSPIAGRLLDGVEHNAFTEG